MFSFGWNPFGVENLNILTLTAGIVLFLMLHQSSIVVSQKRCLIGMTLEAAFVMLGALLIDLHSWESLGNILAMTKILCLGKLLTFC